MVPDCKRLGKKAGGNSAGYTLSGMDGFEIYRRLKAYSLTSDIPVIFTTGVDDIDSETKGLAFGAADCVTKPLKTSLVKAAWRRRSH